VLSLFLLFLKRTKLPTRVTLSQTCYRNVLHSRNDDCSVNIAIQKVQLTCATILNLQSVLNG